MHIPPIVSYQGFRDALFSAGFSLSGGNSEGTFSLCDFFGPNIHWHTADPETDPWEWRMRVVLEEGRKVAYGKFFLRKGGFITKEWAPYFYALRRGNESLETLYYEGNVKRNEWLAYTMVQENPDIPYHELKKAIGGEGFDGVIARLQSGMYINISGQTQRISQKLEPYGWPVNTFCLTEEYWGEEVIEKASALTKEEAADAITARLMELNPAASPRDVDRFLRA